MRSRESRPVGWRRHDFVGQILSVADALTGEAMHAIAAEIEVRV